MRILTLIFILFIQVSVFAWEPPVLSSPNDEAFTEAGVTLDWNSVVGSDGYIIQVDTSQNFDSPVLFEKEEPYINSSNYNDDTREFVDGLFFGQEYHWRVRAFSGGDSSVWVSRTFNTYELLSFTSPSNGTVVETGVTLDWAAFTGVDFYDFQIDTTPDFNSSVLIEGSNAYLSSVDYNADTRTFVDDLFFGHQYYWRIRARTAMDTSEWNSNSFTTKEQIELFSPINGALTEAAVTLDWDAHTGIDFYQYQLDTSALFNSSVLIEGENEYISSINYNNDTKAYISNLFMNETYHWRVRLINAVDTSEWSVADFATDTYVDLTTPIEGALIEVGAYLDWEAFSGADYYDFQLDTTEQFNSAVFMSGSNEATSSVNYNSDTEHYVSKLFFGTNYYWRVRARNENDTTEWKSSTFFTKDNVVLQSPADESILENGVTLNWDAHSGVEFYQYQADTSVLFDSPALKQGENEYISSVNYNDDTEAYIDDLYFGETYFWRVRAGHYADTSAYEMRSFITSNDVDMVSPVDYATNISVDGVTLNWDAHSGIDFYQLQLDTSNLFDNPIEDTLIAYISSVNYNGDTDFYLAELAEETTYFWRLRVINAVDTSLWTQRVFSTGNNVVNIPDAPVLEFPVNNESYVLPDLTYTWTNVTDVTGYDIEWALTDSFVASETEEITSNFYEVSELLIDTTYYWRVRAKNGGIVSEWSSVNNFNTGIEVPQLLAPASGEINIAVDEVAISWSEIDEMTFKVQLASNTDFNPAITATVNNNAYSASGLDYFQDYYWRVQSIYGNYNSEWSEVNHFKTILAAPQLLMPANDSLGVQPDSVMLSWQIVDSADSYLYQYTETLDFSVYIEGVTSETEVSLSELDENTSYLWRVMSIKGEHESQWSEAYNFITGFLTGFDPVPSTQCNIYPNPATNYIKITNLRRDQFVDNIQLINAVGRVIATYKVIGKEIQIDVSRLTSGIYLIKAGNQKIRFVKD